MAWSISLRIIVKILTDEKLVGTFGYTDNVTVATIKNTMMKPQTAHGRRQ